MILTGKAKDDFLNYYWENHINNLPMTICKRNDLEGFFESISELFQNALIIEWLDTKKYRGRPLFTKIFDFFYKFKLDSQSQFDIWIQAIKKANEIYNNQ